MSPKEIKKLIRTLRAAGVSYYKDSDVELRLGDEPSQAPTAKAKAEPAKDLTDDEKKVIEHKLEQVKSLMLGSDEDLLDRLFPVTVEDQEVA